MTWITVSKEKECETLWRFLEPVCKNVTSLTSVLAKTHGIIGKQYETLTDVDGEPDWKEISMMLFGITGGFMEYVEDFCRVYAKLLQELRETLTVSEETNEGGE